MVISTQTHTETHIKIYISFIMVATIYFTYGHVTLHALYDIWSPARPRSQYPPFRTLGNEI